jgi:hypothetical protein
VAAGLSGTASALVAMKDLASRVPPQSSNEHLIAARMINRASGEQMTSVSDKELDKD